MAAPTDIRTLGWAAAWMCVTFTRGLTPEEVFTRYGADPAQARTLAADDAPGDGTAPLLRSGRLNGWTFCVEEDGATGSWHETLTALSRGTETYSVLTTDGLDVFQHWRDGTCVENFEPGMEHTRPDHPTPWWNRTEAALAEHAGTDAGMAPVVALLLDHLGITLTDTTLAGPWPTLTLTEDTTPPAPRGDTYAGEGPVPPGTPLVF
ncbi:DUF6461 domain-containing protein [Streptomyces sp. 4F14]|uniref:DUF6461 domain-containing protein n=1 Tax=Streptomyces sp. 4F14 TaxID=3394380 RepID=UPI003A86A4D3